MSGGLVIPLMLLTGVIVLSMLTLFDSIDSISLVSIAESSLAVVVSVVSEGKKVTLSGPGGLQIGR